MKLAENAMGSLVYSIVLNKGRPVVISPSVHPSKITCPKHIFSPLGLSGSYFTHIVVFSDLEPGFEVEG